MTRQQEAQKVRDVIERYTDAINLQDWDALAPLFADKAIWETRGGPVEVNLEGREMIVAGLRSIVEGLEFMNQSLGAIVVEVEDTFATARVHLSEVGRDLEGKGVFNVGLYFDTFTKSSGQWQFQRRSFRFRYVAQPAQDGFVFKPEPPTDTHRTNKGHKA